MRILIVGAGATGGYFGGRLAQAGRDVTFLVRPGRAAQLERDGLQIRSPHGDLALAPKLLRTGAPTAPFDAVILAVKAYALEPALADLAPAVGPDTMIVPLLNGMRHLDLLIERFGETPVLGGVCRVATTLDDQGRIIQLAGFQDLAYGERDGTLTPRLQALHAALSGAGFETAAAANILQQMWEKWILLAAGGAITCLLRGNVGEIEAAGGAPLARRVLAEASAVAAAADHAPTEKFRANAEKMLTAPGSTFATSMYRDMTAGAPVESDHIIGDMLRRAAAAALDTPLLAAAAAALTIYTARRPA
jgi:2-dehydropantoate 2-reductase